MELLGLQKIVQNKDLRLLDLAEKHWNNADDVTIPLINTLLPNNEFIMKRIITKENNLKFFMSLLS